jgi:hypothetical protein
MAEDVETREAKLGKRMIEVRVRFWTNDLADGKGRIRPPDGFGRTGVSSESHGSSDDRSPATGSRSRASNEWRRE